MESDPLADRLGYMQEIFRYLGTSTYALPVLEFVSRYQPTYVEIENYTKHYRKLSKGGVTTSISPKTVSKIVIKLQKLGLSTKNEEQRFTLTALGQDFVKYLEFSGTLNFWARGRIQNLEQVPEEEREGFIDNIASLLGYTTWNIFTPVDSLVQKSHHARVLNWKGLPSEGWAVMWNDGRVLCGVSVQPFTDTFAVNYLRKHIRYTLADEELFDQYDQFIPQFLIDYYIRLLAGAMDVYNVLDPDHMFPIKWEEEIWSWPNPRGRFWNIRTRAEIDPLELDEPEGDSDEDTKFESLVRDSIWMENLRHVQYMMWTKGRPSDAITRQISELFSTSRMNMMMNFTKLQVRARLPLELPPVLGASIMHLMDEDNFSKRTIQSATNEIESYISSNEDLEEIQVSALRNLVKDARGRWEKHWRKPWSYRAKEERGEILPE